RRHTRCLSDWSSDVCSSDLIAVLLLLVGAGSVFLPKILAPPSLEARYQKAMQDFNENNRPKAMEEAKDIIRNEPTHKEAHKLLRSEERRVGKEGECRYERMH